MTVRGKNDRKRDSAKEYKRVKHPILFPYFYVLKKFIRIKSPKINSTLQCNIFVFLLFYVVLFCFLKRLCNREKNSAEREQKETQERKLRIRFY